MAGSASPRVPELTNIRGLGFLVPVRQDSGFSPENIGISPNWWVRGCEEALAPIFL